MNSALDPGIAGSNPAEGKICSELARISPVTESFTITHPLLIVHLTDIFSDV